MGGRQGNKAAPGQTQFPPISPLEVPTYNSNSLAFKAKRRALRTRVLKTVGCSLSPHTLPAVRGQWACLPLRPTEAKPLSPLWGARPTQEDWAATFSLDLDGLPFPSVPPT